MLIRLCYVLWLLLFDVLGESKRSNRQTKFMRCKLRLNDFETAELSISFYQLLLPFIAVSLLAAISTVLFNFKYYCLLFFFDELYS